MGWARERGRHGRSGFDGGVDGVKNRSEQCEGPGRGARWGKEPEWAMRRTGRGGVNGVKNWSGKCERPGGGDRRV